MPQSASLSLQTALFNTLSADAGLTSLLGGQHTFDHVPQEQMLPYIVIENILSQDWSTGTEEGEEHFITLNIWSSSSGKKQTYEIADKVKTLLDNNTLSLTDHHLITLQYQNSEFKRDKPSQHYIGQVRFRAITEPV